jgi:hypothetical protein
MPAVHFGRVSGAWEVCRGRNTSRYRCIDATVPMSGVQLLVLGVLRRLRLLGVFCLLGVFVVLGVHQTGSARLF